MFSWELQAGPVCLSRWATWSTRRMRSWLLAASTRMIQMSLSCSPKWMRSQGACSLPTKHPHNLSMSASRMPATVWMHPMVCSDLKKKTTSLVLTDLDFSFSELISSGWIELCITIMQFLIHRFVIGCESYLLLSFEEQDQRGCNCNTRLCFWLSSPTNYCWCKRIPCWK